MSTRELFEMASLDVLGLLDEEERAAFENAFRAADPATQAQIRREQRRFAEIDRSLPDVEAPAGLRARVVNAVREAIASVRTEPIGRIGPGTVAVGFNSAPIWRAACIGFATASMVLAGFSWRVQRANVAILQDMTNNRAVESIVDVAGPQGARFAHFLASPGTHDMAFVPAQAAEDIGSAGGKVYFDRNTKETWVMCRNLPIISSGRYSVVVDRKDGRPAVEVASFEASPGLSTQQIKVNPDDVGFLQIRAPIEGTRDFQTILEIGSV